LVPSLSIRAKANHENLSVTMGQTLLLSSATPVVYANCVTRSAGFVF